MTPIADAPVEPTEQKIILAGSEFIITKDRVQGVFPGIPFNLWQAIIGFHRQVSIDHRAESFSYHRFHEKEGRYHTLIPYQKTSKGGLHVAFDWEDARNVELLDKYGEQYGEDFFNGACTIHTHVDVGAFESGTDANDEKGQPGWHITLGNLISHAKYDLDFRMRIPDVPKIRKLARADVAYELSWRHLFAAPITNEDITTTPGTTDWHKFLGRIILK